MSVSIDDILLICAEFERCGWRELHVKIEGLELYLSADPNAPGLDGFRAAAEEAVATAVQKTQTLLAPQLGTIAKICVSVSDAFDVGDELYRLAVLDETRSVVAEAPGVVRKVHAAVGDLVEFEQAVLSIEPAEAQR